MYRFKNNKCLLFLMNRLKIQRKKNLDKNLVKKIARNVFLKSTKFFLNKFVLLCINAVFIQ